MVCCQNVLRIIPRPSRTGLVIFSSPALLSPFSRLMSKTTKHSGVPAKRSGVVPGSRLAPRGPASPSVPRLRVLRKAACTVSRRCLPSSGSVSLPPRPSTCLQSCSLSEASVRSLLSAPSHGHHFSLLKPFRRPPPPPPRFLVTRRRALCDLLAVSSPSQSPGHPLFCSSKGQPMLAPSQGWARTCPLYSPL